MDGWSWPSISEWCLKTSQSSLAAELCRRRRTDLEAVNTQEMNRNKCGGERESDGEGKDESDRVSQTFTLEIPRLLSVINFPSVTLTNSWI